MKNGRLQGKWSLSSVGGQKLVEMAFKDGVPDGASKHWADNGALVAEGAFKRGAPTGMWTRWNEGGRILAVTCYANGDKAWVSFESVDQKATCP